MRHNPTGLRPGAAGQAGKHHGSSQRVTSATGLALCCEQGLRGFPGKQGGGQGSSRETTRPVSQNVVLQTSPEITWMRVGTVDSCTLPANINFKSMLL